MLLLDFIFLSFIGLCSFLRGLRFFMKNFKIIYNYEFLVFFFSFFNIEKKYYFAVFK